MRESVMEALMTDIHCKKCGSVEYVKNGIVRGRHQRYRCRDCGCNFTATPLRGKPASMKALAVLLYAMGNMSMLGIARILGVSDVAVLKWIRKEAENLPEPEIPADVGIVTLDEMWHFLKKRQTSSGSGGPLILSSGELWPGFWVGVMMQPLENSSTKSE
jgi:transposase-like protein